MLCTTSELSAIRVSEAHDCNYQRGGGWVWFGMPSPFTKEKWEEWCRKYSLQSGIHYNVETGKQTNSNEEQWQQNYIPHQIHTTVQLQQRWKEATKSGSQQLFKKTKRCWIMKTGMPGYHENKTYTAEFWINSTGKMNSLIKSPPSNTWSEEHFWSIFTWALTPRLRKSSIP